MTSSDPLLTIIMVSYNTSDLTLAAIRTCLATTRETSFRLVVFDNASTDGSADAIAKAFPSETYPQVELVRSEENLGFAKANNVVAEQADTEFLLLLNPDTECHEGAVDNLIRFARETPDAGIWGGRTVFPDGRLNIASCWNKITLWSVICRTCGLDGIFRRSEFFNPEAMGDWQRDTVRKVDIVVGCFLLIRRSLWEKLDGFDLKYFMYGEEADMCQRAARDGYQPMITPDAQIMHIVGAAAGQRSDKKISVLRARATLIRDYWPGWQVPLGLGLMWIGAGLRRLISRNPVHRDIWASRAQWLGGY